ncbi:hypothetical protein M0Q50_03065 [bacterium]|jgi:hypothetical protein|nr:hypothetical protein [bacterium]
MIRNKKNNQIIMPVQDKDLGKYRRPGIFINEIDSSVVELPVQDVLINLVPGFSKKGPINNPTYVTNKTDFIKIFGDVDRGLERRASYFHRTCLKMLESGPIWALNLLSTNDDRDFLNWETISLASLYDNSGIKTNMPYSRVFNRQDFWKRDDESFLDYVNAESTPEGLLNLTNMGDKTITTFMFKSKTTGFDVSAEDWFGGAMKVPAYIHPKDYISDYIITVVVLEGNWSDYNTLSVDSKWSKYFDSTGLIKTKVEDFLNETNVNVLGYYDASLMPYFKDLNNRNMYIKALINADTDKTGLFCSFDESILLDSDYPTDKLDIIGTTMVGEDKTTIDFLSYKENIMETITYDLQNLNNNGNVFGNFDLEFNYISGHDRKGDKTNGYINNTNIGDINTTLWSVQEIVSGGTLVVGLNGGSPDDEFDPQSPFAINDIVYFTESSDAGDIIAYKPYYIVSTPGMNNNMISISDTKGGVSLTLTNVSDFGGTMYIMKTNIDLTFGANPFFNIDGATYSFNTGETSINIDPLTMSFSSEGVTTYVERYDVLYLSKGDNAIVNILKGTQANAGSAVKPSFNLIPSDYIILGYVNSKTELTTGPASGVTSQKIVINSTYTPVSLSTNGYVPLNIVCSTDADGLIITFNNTSGTTDNKNYNLIRSRQAYNEVENAMNDYKGVIINITNGNKLPVTSSMFGSGDYSSTQSAFITIALDTPTNYYQTGAVDEILLYYVDNEFMISDVATNKLITTLEPIDMIDGSGYGIVGKYSQMYLDYYNGMINNGDNFYLGNDTGSTIEYLKMWFQGTDLYVDIVNVDGDTGDSIENFTTLYGSQLIISSKNSNYSQTVEIESLDETKLATNNIYQISIDKTRYSEVMKGSFLEGYYDSVTGGTRKLVRVIQTLPDTSNINNKIIKTDGPIAIKTITKVGGGYDYSTALFPSIDIYVSTYKGIELAPFKMSNDSIPLPLTNYSAAESRISSILDVIGSTTNLTKGLTNKNKISWRYLIDSFGLGLVSNSKQQLVDLCGIKMNCLGFINMPSVKQLKKSDSPSFINDDATLNTSYLKEGGDLSKSPAYLYTFGTGVGATCVGYFFPYLTINDNGTTLSFPPSSFAATTYMSKFLTTQGGIKPWTIAAGITTGRVNGIGDTEIDFNDDQLEDLYAMGANPIVKKLNAGFCINSESTAKVFPYSSLSIIHSREVLIELENQLYDMLLRYQWKFNTPEVRAEIKYKADKICKTMQLGDALYNYKNVIDETNNTNYIIDLQMGVLDTYIEIIKGMGIIVNNITILKKGDIESGGFL